MPLPIAYRAALVRPDANLLPSWQSYGKRSPRRIFRHRPRPQGRSPAAAARRAWRRRGCRGGAPRRQVAVARRGGRAADGRRAGGDLQPDAAGRLRRQRCRQPVRHERRGAARLRLQQVQRLAGAEGIADVRRPSGGLHAGAAGDGPRRQERAGEDRVDRPPFGRGDHGAHRFALPAVPRPRRQAHRDPQPVRGRLPVPAQDARQREHDGRRRRDRRDGAGGHAGGALCEGGRRLLHRRAVRRGGAARRLCAGRCG